MPIIEITEGGVTRNIVADESFAEAQFHGRWRLADAQPQAPGPSAAQECTPAQGLVALYAVKGLTDQHLQAAIDQIADPVDRYTARIGFARATSWQRGSPTMQCMAQLLKLSEEDLDHLFAYAATVTV